jgi:phage baseplate assembly protein W
MSGMSATTGTRLDGDAHIRQSVRDILTTPIGSRLMRRDYGSLLPDLIDHPGNAANRLRLMSATVMALLRWEPRLAISHTTIDIDDAGNVVVDLDAVRRSGPRAGSPINLSVPIK